MSITRINTNPSAIYANAALSRLESAMNKTMSHLATGLRITTAGDDPSGMAVGAAFTAGYNMTNAYIQNTQAAISALNVAESALGQIVDKLAKATELAVKAKNTAVYTSAQIGGFSAEWQGMVSAIAHLGSSVTFNGKVMFSATLTLYMPGGTNITVSIWQIAPATTATFSGRDLTTMSVQDADAISAFTQAMNGITDFRNRIGSKQNELQGIVENLQVMAVNLAAAKSNVVDADMASELTTFTSQQVIAQAASAMIVQSNNQAQMMIQMLNRI